MRIWLVFLLVSAVASAAEAPRIVCLGDSITDGHTYPLVVQTALKEAKRTPPIFLNAGIGGDTAQGMLARLDRDVISRKPDRVFLSAGINDFGRGLKLDNYLADMGKIADRLAEVRIRLTILTTTSLRNAVAQKELDRWNEALRKLAAEKKVDIADVAAAFAPRIAAGDELWEADGCHLSFAGYRVMARGVLDGLGAKEVPVPEKIAWKLERGVIKNWRIKATDKKPLEAGDVFGAKPDDSWKKYELPESEPHKEWWFDQERQRGFATQLKKTIGDAPQYLAATVLQAPEEQKVWFHRGAYVRTLWLNGKKLYQADPIHGWHIGPPIEAMLQKGENRVLMETGEAFFLSVTETPEEVVQQ